MFSFSYKHYNFLRVSSFRWLIDNESEKKNTGCNLTNKIPIKFNLPKDYSYFFFSVARRCTWVDIYLIDLIQIKYYMIYLHVKKLVKFWHTLAATYLIWDPQQKYLNSKLEVSSRKCHFLFLPLPIGSSQQHAEF